MSEPETTADNIARWEALHASRAWGRYPPEELVRFVGRQYFGVPDRSLVRFLEMGCGQGANLWFLLREGFTACGIDSSQAAILKCRERLRLERLPADMPACDLRAGNFSSLPWADGSFDVVVDVESIYANPMSTIRASVAEALRVLGPGGAFFGKMFGALTTGAGTGEIIEPGTSRDPQSGPLAGHGIAHFFTESEIRALFGSFTALDLGWARRGDGQGIEVFEWIVHARKTG